MRKFLIFFAFLIFGVSASYKADALHISPFMVVFDKNNSATITLNNRGNQAKVVTFEWNRRYYTSDDVVDILPEGQTSPGYNPADPYIQFSPRRAILKPKQAQIIRLIVKRPADMAPGEYRSHFTIITDDLVEEKVDAQANAGGVSGLVSVNVSTGIPVFIRQGETQAIADIQSANVVATPQGPGLDVRMSYNGTRSLYTDLYIECDGDATQKENYVGSMRLYVERESPQRTFAIRKLDISQCSNPQLNVMGVRDLEWGGKLFKQVPINMGTF
ncbi:MAG: hypothetical protein AAF569_05310 [Pseudomonadota bacterium]